MSARVATIRKMMDLEEYQEILDIVPALCSCVGPRNGERYCNCRMWRKAISQVTGVRVLEKKLASLIKKKPPTDEDRGLIIS